MARDATATRRIIKAHIGTSQELAIACPADEILYCGTRGCGKTVAQLLAFRQHVGQGFGADLVGLILDLQSEPLRSIIAESKKLFYGLGDGARYNESTRVWIWPTGERLYFGYCEKPEQAHKWLGHNLAWIGFNELTKWSTPDVYNLICSSLRTSSKFRTRVFSTTNSYGKGHMWVKKMFIDPSPYGVPQRLKVVVPYGDREVEETITRVALLGKYHENPDFKTKDIAGLMLKVQHNPECADSWLDGSWELNIGAAFADVWDNKTHVLKPFDLDDSWLLDCGLDWGHAAPFAYGVFAESTGEGQSSTYPKGTVIQVAEWYGSRGGNKGLQLSAQEVARGIKKLNKTLQTTGRIKTEVGVGIADDQISHRHGIMTVKETFSQEGVRWRMADKSKGSLVHGRQNIRNRLKAARDKEGAGFYVFDNCKHTIEQLPYLQAGEGHELEAVASGQEDHVYDMLRYRLSKRPRSTQTGGVTLAF